MSRSGSGGKRLADSNRSHNGESRSQHGGTAWMELHAQLAARDKTGAQGGSASPERVSSPQAQRRERHSLPKNHIFAESTPHNRSAQSLRGLERSVDAGGTLLPTHSNSGKLMLYKTGPLTKLSKGGFTANWNRRTFALLGSSLYYANNAEALLINPKLFAEISPNNAAGGCEILSWSTDEREKQTNIFALRMGAPEEIGDNQGETLLLATETPKQMLEWMDAMMRARRAPPCPVENVAAMLVSHSLDPMEQGILFSTTEEIRRSALPYSGTHSDAVDSAHPATGATAPSSFARASSSTPGWMEKFLPDLFKNV